MCDTDRRPDADSDADVVVVGGGPAGCSAAVFVARYGLETVVFDRGAGSLDRCAFLTNYLGFPGGIDVETFQALARDHAERAGASVVDDLVERVEREEVVERVEREEVVERVEREDPDGDDSRQPSAAFVVATQDGREVRAQAVVAATRYDGSYLRPVVGDDAFETYEHGGEVHEQFDSEYPDADGRTPVAGLYVASPAGERDVQAIVAAGRGAHVGRSVLEDWRSGRGYPGTTAKFYDWVRPESEFDGQWRDRDRWHEAFAERAPDDHDLRADAFDDLCEAYVDRVFDSRRTDAEVTAATERAHRRLLDHVDDDLIRERAAELADGDGADPGTAPEDRND